MARDLIRGTRRARASIQMKGLMLYAILAGPILMVAQAMPIVLITA
jgi:hypothetical protein